MKLCWALQGALLPCLCANFSVDLHEHTEGRNTTGVTVKTSRDEDGTGVDWASDVRSSETSQTVGEDVQVTTEPLVTVVDWSGNNDSTNIGWFINIFFFLCILPGLFDSTQYHFAFES